MKAYQVFKGDTNKHGHQYYELIATYLDKQRALDHAEKIVNGTPLYGDTLESYDNGKYKCWDAIGWERVTIVKFREIDIIE